MTYYLREVKESDHEWLVELHNDPEVLRNITDPRSITIEQHLAWWSSISSDPRQLRLMFAIGDEQVGFTKFYNIDRANSSCTLGADIHKKHRGHGYAHIMWTLMLDRVFLDMKLHRAALTTAEYNAIGIHIYRKLGFREEGRLEQSLLRDGVFRDQICMRLLRPEWRVLD